MSHLLIIVKVAQWTASDRATNPGSPLEIAILRLALRRGPHTWPERVYMGEQTRQGAGTGRRGWVRCRGRVFEQKRCPSSHVASRFITHLLFVPAQPIDGATRTAIARVSNVIRALARHFVPITDTLLVEAYEWALDQECDVKDLLQEETAEALVAAMTTRA
jgi:hypothetical protein